MDRAAAALGIDRSTFLLAQGRLAAQRVLVDRQHTLRVVSLRYHHRFLLLPPQPEPESNGPCCGC